jgi:threonyl-tRNA synthetase
MTEKIEHVRHSLAHLLAAASLEIYPDAKVTLGPAVDDGFYYDIDFGENKITDKELKDIQKKMKKLLNKWEGFEEISKTPEEAREFFKDNPYKLELIDEIEEKGESITFYKSGDFIDLCRGGHVESMKNVSADSFKLDRVAGAYWRGDENNAMLTRIYGIAFENKEKLDEYLKIREEAKERDHRKIGKELDLFTFSEKVGQGLPLFTPKGTAIRKAIMDKIYEIQSQFDVQEVHTPHITKNELYKTSGHWDKFKEELFHVKGKTDDFVVKPMNCPHHTQIFASSPKSYKDLPLRYVELGSVYRDEQSGELLGLGRVRSISMDDGHTFCTPEQIENEIKIIISTIKEFYGKLGLLEKGSYKVSLSFKDSKNPEKYLGEDSVWEKSQSALEKIAKDEDLEYEIFEGEAAFYGPKIDFMFNDALGRERQLGTVQLDFNMPARFKLEYTDKDGSKQTPVMIHRAIAGSLERFLSIAIEHFAGNFPFWMSPVQAVIVPVAEPHEEKAKELRGLLKKNGFRIETNLSNDSFGKKIRTTKKEKVPYTIIIGDKDLEADKVTLESRDDGQIGQLSIEEIIERFKEEN